MTTNETLYAIEDHSWRQGLGALLRKENRAWWGTRKWLVQSVIWLIIINGILALVLWLGPEENSGEALSPAEAKDLFIVLFSTFSAIGVIVWAQGAIVGEKKIGTAEWIMSNPVSRSAFVLAKFLAYGLAALIILVLLQSAVFYLQFSLSEAELISFDSYALAIFFVSLNLAYFLALTLMLGTFFNSRGPVIGISIGILVGQDIVASLLGEYLPWIGEIMPQKTMQYAQLTIHGQEFDSIFPLIFTTAMTVLFIAAAMWRFERQEF